MLDHLLAKLGFSDKEATVYLALLQYGKMTPAELAKTTRISRPTVYSVAKELVKKGVLLEDLGGTTLLLVAKKPEDFMVVVNREQKKLDERKQLVEQTISELQKVAQSTKYAIPKIVFIPEEELGAYLYKQTMVWNKSMLDTDGIYWGFQDHTLVDSYQDWIDWYWQQPQPLPTLQLLSNTSETEVRMQSRGYSKRNIRFWNGAGAFSATTWVMGNYVVMIITNQQPHYLIEVHDAMMAQNLRQLFKGIWNMASTQ